MLDSNMFLEIFNNYSNIAMLISIIISIIIAILGLVPSVFVTGANMLFFGPVLGFIVSLFGETLGNYISFKIYKKSFKKVLVKKIYNYKTLRNILESSGNKTALLIFQARIIPFIPSGLVTLAASVTEINDLKYNVATFFGKIPSILIEMLVSYGILTSGTKGIQLTITLISIYLIYKTIKKIGKSDNENNIA